MSSKVFLTTLLLGGLATAVPADEAEVTPGLSDRLPSSLVQRGRELAAPATDKAYVKCLATLAPPTVCECLARRVPLRFDWLCEVKVIDRAGSTAKQVSASPTSF